MQKMLGQQTYSKQNYCRGPSSSSKTRVQQMRKEFFKKASNQGQSGKRQQMYTPKAFTGLEIQNKSHNKSVSEFRDARQTRSYSAIKDKNDQSQIFEKLHNQNFCKKESRMRRQFDIRVGNINKISSKIEDLLQFIKKPRVQQKAIQPVRNQQKASVIINDQKNNLQIMKQKQLRKLQITSQNEQNCRYQHAKNSSLIGQGTGQQTPKKYDYTDKDFLRKVDEKKSIIVDSLSQTKRCYLKIEHDKSSTRVFRYQNRNQSELTPKNSALGKQITSQSSTLGKQNSQYRPNDRYMRTPKRYSDIQNMRVSPIVNELFEISKKQQVTAVEQVIHQRLMQQQIMSIKKRIEESQRQRRKLQEKYPAKPQSNKYSYSKPIQRHSAIQKRRNNIQKPQISNFQLKIIPVEEFKQTISPQATLRIPHKDKKQSLRLAQSLAKQVSCDSKLKTARQKFSGLGSKQKWGKLKAQLYNRGLDISIEKLKQQLVVSIDEHNPFDSELTDSKLSCIQDLAEAYLESYIFWENKITNCVSSWRLKAQGFNIKEIDLQKKGYLSIEDFLCFLNLQTGKFYLNRDAIMLYKRFMKLQTNVDKAKGVEYSTFMNKVAGNV